MKGYCEHPFFYGDKCYAKVNGQMIEISREVALAMHNSYRAGLGKKIVIRDEDGKIIKKRAREVPYSYVGDNEGEFSIEMMPDVLCDVEDKAVNKVFNQGLWDVIDRLTTEEKFLIHGIYFENKSQKEMAAILGVTQPAVAFRLKNILAKMRNMFF